MGMEFVDRAVQGRGQPCEYYVLLIRRKSDKVYLVY
jgi:hypothetical protein